MQLAEDVHKFTSGCEHLLSGIETHRSLTKDEISLIKHYCKEVLSKIDQTEQKS
mgnify:CR=1